MNARHIPEEELHAYLDQALSRSQCVEIECHMAACFRCRMVRDEVASMRDRVTAMLADASAASRPAPPPFAELIARHQHQTASRRRDWTRIGRRGALAASLVGAIAAGWWTRDRMLERAPLPAPQANADAAAATPPEAALSASTRELVSHTDVQPLELLTPDAASESPALVPPMSGSVQRVSAPKRAPLTVQVVSFESPDEIGGPALAGLWQAVDWYQASTMTGGNLPRIDGLPVIDVQIQPAPDDARPMVVVAQEHPSGIVVRTIEGPVERVAALVEAQATDRFNASAASFTPPDYLVEGGVTKRGLRVLTVTGSLPADSLNALAKNISLRE